MTDKVQKIREEVVEIVNSINPFIPDEDGKNSDYEAGRLDEAIQILQIIDSLEEPVSEDLEEAAMQYAKDYLFTPAWKRDLRDHFKAGAQWQKERDEDEMRVIRELLDNFDKTCDEYHDAGFKHGQEALMKDAVDAKVIARWPLHSSPLYYSYEMYVPYAKHLSEGDKVKLIIIKED